MNFFCFIISCNNHASMLTNNSISLPVRECFMNKLLFLSFAYIETIAFENLPNYALGNSLRPYFRRHTLFLPPWVSNLRGISKHTFSSRFPYIFSHRTNVIPIENELLVIKLFVGLWPLFYLCPWIPIDTTHYVSRKIKLSFSWQGHEIDNKKRIKYTTKKQQNSVVQKPTQSTKNPRICVGIVWTKGPC